MLTPERPDWREILREAADTQHIATLTWQEAREVLNVIDGLTEAFHGEATKATRFASKIAEITTADEQAVADDLRSYCLGHGDYPGAARRILEALDAPPNPAAEHIAQVRDEVLEERAAEWHQ